jgi:hypothetical protein
VDFSEAVDSQPGSRPEETFHGDSIRLDRCSEAALSAFPILNDRVERLPQAIGGTLRAPKIIFILGAVVKQGLGRPKATQGSIAGG